MRKLKAQAAGKEALRLRDEVSLIAYDFDGVMTDNSVLIFDDGREAVFVNRSDGGAVNAIKEMGIPQVIISTETNPVVRRRADKLGIEALCGIEDKKKAILEYCASRRLDIRKAIFIGNDMNDLEAMKAVGMPMCPEDAYHKVKMVSRVVLPARGGEGVVKKLLDLLCEARSHEKT